MALVQFGIVFRKVSRLLLSELHLLYTIRNKLEISVILKNQ